MTTTPVAATRLQRAGDELVSRVGLPESAAVYLKREDEHELGAFKWRGALPTVTKYKGEGAASVVTASTGNHGAATAWACRQLGLDCVVFGPERCSETKLALIRGQGAATVLSGADLDEAKDAARIYAAEQALPFFEDGAEPAQFDGYATVTHELLAQLDVPPARVLVPLGNGALLIGVGRALRAASPASELVAVVAREAPVMARSVAARKPVDGQRCATFADGLAARVAIADAVDAIVELDCTMVEVAERDLAVAVGDYAAAGIRAEGSAAAPLAALRQMDHQAGANVLLVTGRNIDDALHTRAIETPESFPV